MRAAWFFVNKRLTVSPSCLPTLSSMFLGRNVTGNFVALLLCNMCNDNNKLYYTSWRWPPPCLDAHILKTVPAGCLSSESLLCRMLGRQRPSPWSCPSNHSHTLCNTHKRESLVTRLFNNTCTLNIWYIFWYLCAFICLFIYWTSGAGDWALLYPSGLPSWSAPSPAFRMQELLKDKNIIHYILLIGND